MDDHFSRDDELALDQLRRDVVEHRSIGTVLVEFRRRHAPGESTDSVASAFVKALSLRSPDAWTELDPRSALEVATRVLHTDLAYDTPMMTIELAEALAGRFVACCGEGASFVTNGSLAQRGTGGAWSPLTEATFDTGIIGVSLTRIGMLWVQDED
jgi:hypothetical protein